MLEKQKHPTYPQLNLGCMTTNQYFLKGARTTFTNTYIIDNQPIGYKLFLSEAIKYIFPKNFNMRSNYDNGT